MSDGDTPTKERSIEADESVTVTVSGVSTSGTSDTEVNLQSKHGVTLEVKPLRTHRSRPLKTTTESGATVRKILRLDPDEMHNEILCQCYGSEEIESKFGVVRRPVKRSNDATRGDYSDLIDTLCRVAAEMGYDVPPPEITN